MIIEKLLGKEMNIKIGEVTVLSGGEFRQAKNQIVPTREHWWLRSPGTNRNYASIASPDCTKTYDSAPGVSMGVRPALRILSGDLKVSDRFFLANYTWTVVLDGKEKDTCVALCDSIVGKSYFKQNPQMEMSNLYEASDLKEWLRYWAASAGIIPEGAQTNEEAE